jgi:hypothetical protein
MWGTALLYVTTIIANLAALGVLNRNAAALEITALCYAICGCSGALLWIIIVRRLRCAFWREVETTIGASASLPQGAQPSARVSDSPEIYVVRR